jgi:hypothetical protein
MHEAVQAHTGISLRMDGWNAMGWPVGAGGLVVVDYWELWAWLPWICAMLAGGSLLSWHGFGTKKRLGAPVDLSSYKMRKRNFSLVTRGGPGLAAKLGNHSLMMTFALGVSCYPIACRTIQ